MFILGFNAATIMLMIRYVVENLTKNRFEAPNAITEVIMLMLVFYAGDKELHHWHHHKRGSNRRGELLVIVWAVLGITMYVIESMGGVVHGLAVPQPRPCRLERVHHLRHHRVPQGGVPSGEVNSPPIPDRTQGKCNGIALPPCCGRIGPSPTSSLGGDKMPVTVENRNVRELLASVIEYAKGVSTDPIAINVWGNRIVRGTVVPDARLIPGIREVAVDDVDALNRYVESLTGFEVPFVSVVNAVDATRRVRWWIEHQGS